MSDQPSDSLSSHALSPACDNALEAYVTCLAQSISSVALKEAQKAGVGHVTGKEIGEGLRREGGPLTELLATEIEVPQLNCSDIRI